MSARRALPWIAGALGAAAAAGIVAWTAFGSGGEAPVGTAGSAPVAGVASVAPRSQFVADRVQATIELTVNRSLADPASVEVRPAFRPYTRVAPVEVERVDAGATTHLRYRYVLQCIDRACIERVAGSTFAFAPAIVQYPTAAVGQGTIALPFPQMTVASRLAPGDLSARQFRADADTPPELGYAVAPALLGWLLAGAAAAIVLALAAVAVVLLRRAAPRAAVVVPGSASPSPLARALARVDAAAGEGGEPERRSALDELARALEADGMARLAPVVRRLAWSRAAPGEADLHELAASVRRAPGAEP